jgi:cobalamin biosynthesis Mg chelatase CobN
MRSQEQDQKSFDQIRQAERKQDQMLSKINQIDQEQEQEIQDLEQQNSGLAQRLQQLQSVNSKLEKKLAAMSGRKTKSKDSSPDTIGTVGEPIAPKSSPTTVEPATTKVKTKNKTAPNAIKSTATQLAAPKADPMAAMATRIQRGDSSIINPKQAALPFEPSDNVLEPTIPQTQQNPKFAAARAGATDVDPKYYADIAKKVAGSPEKFKAAMGGVNENNKGSEKSERPEADYGDEYQAMVQRVGQKAAQGPRKTVWDPVKRVYKTVPVNK